MTAAPLNASEHHAAALKRTARRCWIFGLPALVAGACAAVVQAWLGVHGTTSWLVVGAGALVAVLGLALLGLGLVCTVILVQARMKQRSDQRALRRATKRAQQADAKRAKQQPQATIAQPPAQQPEAVAMAASPMPPSVQTQAGNPQSSDRPPLIF